MKNNLTMVKNKFPVVVLVLMCLLDTRIIISQPRLVVGITVDQMRYDYLYHYWSDYGENGFKRLLREGHVVHDGHYHYAPTYTGPGHASIYTGTGPAHHGIIGNNWYSRTEKKIVYCAEDPYVKSIGSESVEGLMSPRRLTSTTIADQLEFATNRRSRTIGISLKDRGSILPVGTLADGAYWYDKTNGSFITSSYYMKELPSWVQNFNQKKLPEQLIDSGWKLLLPLERYDESQPDDKPYERPFINTEKAVFPYNLKTISEIRRFGVGESKFGIVASSPQGNTLTLAFAKAAIEGEQMGKDEFPDLLALSFSTPDYAGHQFGPHSMEVQDIYLRLDLELGDFLNYLDKQIGLKNVLIFLTADHGAADVPGFLLPQATDSLKKVNNALQPPAGYFQTEGFETLLRKRLVEKFKKDPIEFFINEQIYFSKNHNLDVHKLEEAVRDFALAAPGVHNVVNLNDFASCRSEPTVCETLRKGYLPGRSGDLYIQLMPGWIDKNYTKGGTTHGSPYAYDTHVPILFFGGNIAPQDNYDRVWVEDIAPTVCSLLKIARPSGCTGRPIVRVFEK
jgi:predicted AlkP superfamily pyrophosphatase or phosphodiesterase